MLGPVLNLVVQLVRSGHHAGCQIGSAAAQVFAVRPKLAGQLTHGLPE